MKLSDLTDDERKLFEAVKVITHAQAQTILDMRPMLIEKFGIGELGINCAVTIAFHLNAALSAKFTDAWIFDFPDGENIMQLLVSSNSPGINKSGYSNPDVDKLYVQLKEQTHVESREKTLQAMEELVFDDLPWIPLMYESSFVLQSPKIKNFRKSSLIRNYVKYLKIEK